MLDGFDARNATISGDLTRASFKRAHLNGCYFDGAVLREADFTAARIEQASLRGCDCTGARFVDARMRFTTMSDAVLVGADVSGADLTEAFINNVKFDDSTRLSGALLAGARLDDALAGFATAQGAEQPSEAHGFALAHLDATATLLRERNNDGRLDSLLARIGELRDNVAKDPDFEWVDVVDREFPDDLVDEVAAAAGEADVSDHAS